MPARAAAGHNGDLSVSGGRASGRAGAGAGAPGGGRAGTEPQGRGGGHARVESVHIRNFRSLRDVKVRLGDITVLIGANGTGKTTVLDALALFASKRPIVEEDDYHQDADCIEITLAVDPGGHDVEEKFLRDGLVRLQRSFCRDGGEDRGGIKAEARRNVDFEAARRAKGAAALKAEAEKIRKAYECVPEYRNMRQFLESLDRCERELSGDPRYADRYQDGFVEFPGGQDRVAGMLTVIHVPAMKDIEADGGEGAGSLLSELMNMAVRGAQDSSGALAGISSAMDAEYEKYKEAVRGTVDEIGSDLEESAGAYMDDAEFEIDLENPRFSASHPDATVRMGDGGFMALAGRAGSGLQRVYLLSLLDTIANRRGKRARVEAGEGKPPALRLVAIDEPELYQHPQRQRRILRNFIDVSAGDSPVSIVCSTHSPYFVELQKIDKLRLLRKGERPKSITPKELEGLDARLRGDSAWLDMNATHWITEGFFARLAVVVEGSSDRNALLAAARAMRRAGNGSGAADPKGRAGSTAGRTAGVDLDGHEITIVPAGGVENMDIISKLLAEFGIPVYMVWDLDCRGGGCDEGIRDRNRELVSIASGGRRARVPKKTVVRKSHACFEASLTEVMADELLERGELLGDMEEHRRLQEAAEADRKAMLGGGSKRCAFCECWDRAKGGEKSPKRIIASQKRVLRSKLAVFRMLDRIREADPQSLEEMKVAEIVRKLEEVAKGLKARRRGRRVRRGGSRPAARKRPARA